MTRRHLALAAIAGFAALLVLAVWQVPQWLDWTRYRATIEVLASARLGQSVTIRGPITLTLLPEPVLTASQVDVGGREASDLSIHVDALRLRIALLPLMRGAVDARELVLRGPDLHIPWPAEPGMLRPRPPAWLAAWSARVEQGRLTIGKFALKGIDATLATLETGALSVSGSAEFSGQSWHLTARLTAAGPDGASGLNLTLDGQGPANGLGASFTGQLAQDGTLVGRLAGRGPNLGLLLPTPAVPFRAEGRLTVGSGLAALDDLALEIGGSPASGVVALRVSPRQRLDIAVSASRLDLDAWLPVLLRAGNTVAGFDMPIGIDFSAEAAPLGGGTLEHLRAAFDLVGNDLIVREATATLPGNGRLRLSGRVQRDDLAHPRLEGDARLDAPVLRTTLRWLEDAVPGVVPARLLAGLPSGFAQRAELTAHVVVGRGDVALQRLAGTLDDVPVAGSFGLKRGEPPSYFVNLSLDRAALDGWLPSPLAGLGQPNPDLDAELRIDIRQASLAGATIDGLAIDAAFEAGTVQVRRLEGTALGAHFIASGLLGSGTRLSEGKLALTTGDATPLSGLLPPALRATPALWHGAAGLAVEATGPPNALAVDVRLTMADGQLEASPTIDLRSGDWAGALTLRHPGAPRLVATLGLAAPVGLGSLPGWLGDGSLSLVAHLAGGPGRLTAEPFNLAAGALRATGTLSGSWASGEPRITGRVSADALSVPLPSGGSDVPLPLALLSGWRGDVQFDVRDLALGSLHPLHDAAFVASLANGLLRLDKLSAKVDPELASGSVSGGLALDAAATPPTLAFQAKVSHAVISGPLAGTPIDLLSGSADASLDLAAVGYSPSAFLATLAGHAALTVKDGTLSGFDLFRLKLALEKPDPKTVQVVAKEVLRSGTTAFDRLELNTRIAHGDLTISAGRLTGAAGDVQASGGVNLASRMLDVILALQPALPSPPEVTLRLSGSIDRPVRSPELAGLARWIADLAH